VALWDVLPTVAALARVPAPRDLDGISLLPELLGGGKETNPRAGGLYWETAEASPSRALIWDSWKIVERFPGGSVELHDLRSDAAAVRDVAAQQPERVAEGRRRLREAADPLPNPPAEPRP